MEDLFPGDLNGVDLLRVDPGASRAESFITTQSRLLPSTFHVKRFSFSLLVSNGWTFSGVIFMAAVWVGGRGEEEEKEEEGEERKMAINPRPGSSGADPLPCL